MSLSSPTDSQRIISIDAFRGFALAGIVLVHFLEEYIAGAAPPDGKQVEPMMLDGIIDGLAFFLIRGKFFALFSLLFGLSFFIQMDRAAKREEPYVLRFVWRLAILMGIGFIHSLFYRGDILTLYALVGLFLVPFHRANNTVLLMTAGLLLLGAGRWIVFSLYGGDPIFVAEMQGPDNPESIAYYETLKSGSLWEVFSLNALKGNLQKAEFQFNVFGRGYITLACFLIGYWLGRVHFFDRLAHDKRLLKRSFFYALGFVGVVTPILILVAMNMGGEGGPDQLKSWNGMIGLTLYDLWNMGLTVLLLIGFLWIFQSKRGQSWFGGLAPYGRMALTNYVSQTILGTFLLFGWGLGFIGQWNQWLLALVAIIVLIVQIFVSKWWLQRFHYGPLEWGWRALTYFKVPPFRKQS